MTKILIAEDDEDSRILLCDLLQATGHQVVQARTGKEALALLEQQPIDLIISDLLMPEMDGFTLCKRVKTDERFRRIPFVVYTATYTDPRDQALAMDLGASKFLLKPMDTTVFLDEIREVLEAHTADRLPRPSAPKAPPGQIEADYRDALTRKLEKKILDLQRQREDLAASEARYQRLMRALAREYIFFSKDAQGRVTHVSPSVTGILGYDQEEFCRCFDGLPTAHPANEAGRIKAGKTLAGLVQDSYEVEWRCRDGGAKWLEISEAPVFDETGRVCGVEGLARDVTQTKQLQRRLQKAQQMEAIGTLAGGIAHDFNNILTAILGFGEMLQLALPEGSEEHHYAAQIHQASLRAQNLVNQILAFSRQDEQEKQPIQIQFIAKEALKLLRSSIPKAIDIVQEIDQECPAVLADPSRIYQVIMNLCTNAYQAIGTGPGTMTVAVRPVEIEEKGQRDAARLPPGHYVLLEVRDTGCGMDEALREKIFDPYFTTKEKNQGTGLGLAVVQSIVHDCQGHIQVDSRKGEGSVFRIYLPALDDVQAGGRPEAQAEDLTGLQGDETVLLVDDEPAVLQVEQQMLERLGYQVWPFSDAEAALRAVRLHPDWFDLVITDVGLEGTTGLELAKAIRGIRPDLPLVACTGYSELVDRNGAGQAGFAAYLQKPLRLPILARTVREVLDRRAGDGEAGRYRRGAAVDAVEPVGVHVVREA